MSMVLLLSYNHTKKCRTLFFDFECIRQRFSPFTVYRCDQSDLHKSYKHILSMRDSFLFNFSTILCAEKSASIGDESVRLTLIS